MSWKRWKMGMAVAGGTGVLTGFVGLAVGVTWKQAAYLVGLSVGKDLLLYLTDASYREKIVAALPTGDTESITKDNNQTNQGQK
jgi:hypothetical protein